MKQELKLIFGPSDLAALNNGQPIHLEMAHPGRLTLIAPFKAPVPDQVERAVLLEPQKILDPDRCSDCKRDLRRQKHAVRCRVLRQHATNLRLRRMRARKTAAQRMAPRPVQTLEPEVMEQVNQEDPILGPLQVQP